MSKLKLVNSYTSGLLLAMCISSTAIAADGGNSEPGRLKVSWVEPKEDDFMASAREAGYVDAMSDPNERLSGTMYTELAAKALPESRISILKNKQELSSFWGQFMALPLEQIDYAPDFNTHTVLAFSIDKTQSGDLIGDFEGMEVYKTKDGIRAYAIFRPEFQSQAAAKNTAGHVCFFTIPSELAEHEIELRVASCSWAVVCAKFSHPITNLDADMVPASESAE